MVAGDAVEGTPAANELLAIDRHDPPGGETGRQRAESRFVGWPAKHRHHHGPIRHIEIQMAGRQLRALEGEPRWNVDRDHVQPTAPRINGRLQLREILRKRRMVGVETIGLPRRHDTAGGHEPSDLVDVAVGVVSRQFASQPDDSIVGEPGSAYLLHRVP